MFFPYKLFNKKIVKIGMKTEIPFAPFLVIGTLVAFIFNLNISLLINLFHF